MMDYYEELGVDRSASPDEIRQAYKHLVRLLHPDHCSDDRVRPLADLQMKRLNGVLRVLTNPEEREIYDRSVFGRLSPQGFPHMFPAPLPPPPRPKPQWFWAVAGASTFLALVALLAYTPQSAPRQIAAPEQTGPVSTAAPKKPARQGLGASGVRQLAPSPSPQPLIQGPGREQSPSMELDVSPRDDSSPVALTNDPPVVTPTLNIGSLPDHPVEIEPAVPGLEPAHKPPGPRLTGVWLLLPSPHAKTNGLYPPDYIELSLNEESGILRGRYRARYHIPDQAISPTVSFQFEGPAGPDRASLPWSGAGGARGEVRLRLLTPGTLEVAWVANQLSEELGLISGTATLVRKLD